MSEKPLYCFTCPECHYDWKEAKSFAILPAASCPLCAGDSGHDVALRMRPATAADFAWMEQHQRLQVKRHVQ